MADYNIAMGVKQPEPVNYLGQMAQMYALKAAQDEMQGNEAVKQFYAQGGDLSTPEARARLKSLNPKFGMAAEKAQSDLAHTQATTQKARNDSLKEAIALSVAGLANIGDVDSYRAWSLAHHDPKLNPELSSYFSRIGSTPDKAQARIDEMVAKYGPAEGLQRLKNESMGAVPELFKHLNQSADNKATNAQSDVNNRRTVGVTARGQDLTANTAAANLAFQKAKGKAVAAEGQFLREDVYGNLTPIDQYGTQFGPNAPVDARSAAILGANAAAPVAGAPANAMLTGGGGAAAPMLNNLNPAAQASGAGPTVAAAAQLAAPQARPLPPAGVGYEYVNGKRVKIAPPPTWDAKTNSWISPPTAENPTGKAVAMPEADQNQRQLSARQALQMAGYNPETGLDDVSKLIRKSTSGMGQRGAAATAEFLTGSATSGMEAIAALEGLANTITLEMVGGKLGAGFSNEDRNFILGRLGDVANPNKGSNARLKAWEMAVDRLKQTAGYATAGQASGGDVTPPTGYKLD